MKMKKILKAPATTSDPTSSATATTSSPPIPSGADLKALIHDHSLFFDRLVELIPARFYLPIDEKERPWFQGLSKAAKASAKKESRENLKKARRERLDPEKATTTLDLLKKSIEAGKGNPLPDDRADDRAVTLEGLQQRLRRRIAEMRAKRNTRTLDNPRPEKEEKKKRRRDDKAEEGEVKEEERKKQKEEKEKDAASVDFTFGHVKLRENGEEKRKRKSLPKEKALKKAEELKEAMKDPEKGKEVSKKHSWKAALSRAAGTKVHDDPKLIKESIKKEKKRREKASEKWKERVETVEKLKSDKQKKRRDNISEKIHQKKMKKIEKREKKLMRPGFEGRKEGYINES